jgi:hypothetical protein
MHAGLEKNAPGRSTVTRQKRFHEGLAMGAAIVVAVAGVTVLLAPRLATSLRQTADVPSPIASPALNPCGPYTCDGPGAQIGIVYPYKLSTHCGVLQTRFDGRIFYVESLNPDDVSVGLDQPVDTGTMVLLSTNLAAFEDSAGHHIRFVDSPPGEVGKQYSFTVHVAAGSNQLRDEKFAGRIWHPQGDLLGRGGPPSLNGRDAYTPVTGTLTLQDEDHAVFATPAGQRVAFIRAPVGGCD